MALLNERKPGSLVVDSISKHKSPARTKNKHSTSFFDTTSGTKKFLTYWVRSQSEGTTTFSAHFTTENSAIVEPFCHFLPLFSHKWFVGVEKRASFEETGLQVHRTIDLREERKLVQIMRDLLKGRKESTSQEL